MLEASTQRLCIPRRNGQAAVPAVSQQPGGQPIAVSALRAQPGSTRSSGAASAVPSPVPPVQRHASTSPAGHSHWVSPHPSHLLLTEAAEALQDEVQLILV